MCARPASSQAPSPKQLGPQAQPVVANSLWDHRWDSVTLLLHIGPGAAIRVSPELVLLDLTDPSGNSFQQRAHHRGPLTAYLLPGFCPERKRGQDWQQGPRVFVAFCRFYLVLTQWEIRGPRRKTVNRKRELPRTKRPTKGNTMLHM